MKENQTPRQAGYRMPAEWEPHSAVWLSWPHDRESFPHLPEAEAEFADFVAAISKTEKVELQVVDEAMRQRAEPLLVARGVDFTRVRFRLDDYTDIWFRDYGPAFVVNRETKELAMVKWEFNAWGNKYEEMVRDNDIPYRMNEDLKLPLFEAGLILEGGSIEVNGAGTVLTTEQCLLNKNRNPELSQEAIEQKLRDNLNVTKIVWLKEGVAGDDTDGHIDDLARFVDPTTIVCAFEENPEDQNYAALKENYDALAHSVDQDGKPFTIIKLPMPGEVLSDSGNQLPASYTNFYIGNQVVIVPLFGTANDQRALEILRPLFPDSRVVGLMARYIIFGNGTFHCMSQQQPIP